MIVKKGFFFAREQYGGNVEDGASHYLPKHGWIRTLENFLRYKAKKGDTIIVQDEQQRFYVQNAVNNRAPHLKLTVKIAEDHYEDESLILR